MRRREGATRREVAEEGGGGRHLEAQEMGAGEIMTDEKGRDEETLLVRAASGLL